MFNRVEHDLPRREKARSIVILNSELNFILPL